MRFLPDVNALLALLDPMHVHHDAAHRWFASQLSPQIILCSHVVNGVIRVASQPKYPNCLGTSGLVREVLRGFVKRGGTAVCERDISLLDDEVLLNPELLTPSHIADLYLLALAVSHGVRLATFDRRIPVTAISGGAAALEVIPI